MFEFDINKSLANKEKHGIDFEEAQELWLGMCAELPPFDRYGEFRNLVLGKINDKHYTAIITRRGDNIRIISVRRSRKEEEDLYEANISRRI